MIYVTSKRDGRWKVTWQENSKEETIAVTNYKREAETIVYESERALVEERHHEWMMHQKAVRYDSALKKWYISMSICGKKHYLGHLSRYIQCRKLYEEILEFMDTHDVLGFYDTYGHFLEQYRVDRLILKVQSGQIFSDDGNGKIKVVLTEKKARYPMGHIFPDEIKEIQEELISVLSKGMNAFRQWYRAYFFRQRLEEHLFSLIGKQATERMVPDFANRCLDSAVVRECHDNGYIITSGLGQAKLTLRVNKAGIVTLPEIEYMERE